MSAAPMMKPAAVSVPVVVSLLSFLRKESSMYAEAILEVEDSPPAPPPKRKPVGVVEPVPPRETVRVPTVSDIAIARDDVDVVAHPAPV